MKSQYTVLKVSKVHKVLPQNILIDNVLDFLDQCFENNFKKLTTKKLEEKRDTFIYTNMLEPVAYKIL